MYFFSPVLIGLLHLGTEIVVECCSSHWTDGDLIFLDRFNRIQNSEQQKWTWNWKKSGFVSLNLSVLNNTLDITSVVSLFDSQI